MLEIGCGTGKATLPMLERGFEIVCVELGADLARVARRNLVGRQAEVHVSPFEEWDWAGRQFDLVYVATAWHWLDPAVRLRKAHALLRPGGHLAHWKAMHAFPPGFDPFFTEIEAVYDEIGENWSGDWPPPPPDLMSDEREEIEASGLFDDVTVRRYVWDAVYTAEQYIAVISTFSGHIAMAEDKREYLYKEIRRRISGRPGSRVRRHWCAILHVARRAPQSSTGS